MPCGLCVGLPTLPNACPLKEIVVVGEGERPSLESSERRLEAVTQIATAITLALKAISKRSRTH